MSDEYDVLFKNALIVDGTGAPSFKGGLAIKGERIQKITKDDFPKGDYKKILDVKGNVVSPGFIDVHNHVDLSILYYPRAESFVRQGITSFVGGHCGDSTGPYNEFIGEPWFYVDIYQEVRPTMGRSEWLIPKDDFNVRHKELYGWEINFKTMADYFKKVEETKLSPNMAPMVGHGDIRSYVMGMDYKRYAKKKEINEMKKLVEQAMLDGCIGLSVGRTYEPGRWASFEEILACAKVASKYGGVYNSHSLRSLPRGDMSPDDVPAHPIWGIQEVIEIGKKAKMSVEVSHLGSGWVVTPDGNDIMTEAGIRATLKVIDDAVKEKVNIHFDIIPHYQTGGIFTSPYLFAIFSQWEKIAGSPEQLAKAFNMKDLREEIKKKINSGDLLSVNPKRDPLWAEKLYVKVCKDERFVDKNIKEIADLLKVKPVDVLFDILQADPWTKTMNARTKDDWAKLEYFKHPRMMIGCDTFAIDENYQCKTGTLMLPNQNAFGGMAYYLRRMIREKKLLTIEEAVRKITKMPADKFMMKDRGILKEGAYADITVWNPKTIKDNGDQIEPRRYPDGIMNVIINGQIVVEDNKHTGALSGKILYRQP
ncbi:amidohydrolase family protein [Candidatus Bathyarchaeota archaeon]|nr:amidohydrolase family protein [Candidatus Bathyarchaeota archaeon]